MKIANNRTHRMVAGGLGGCWLSWCCHPSLHEFLRDTPRIWLGLSGYQFIALAMVVVGGVMMWRRTKSMLARSLAEGSLAA
jgi:hypothetical protein